MLVLSRYLGEFIIIAAWDAHGNPVRISIELIGIQDSCKARLGFEAPPSIRIDRLEVDRSRTLHPRLGSSRP